MRYYYAFQTQCIPSGPGCPARGHRPCACSNQDISRATPFDTDNDGTVDIDEAKKAAGELFDKLDTDKDGTLMSRS